MKEILAPTYQKTHWIEYVLKEVRRHSLSIVFIIIIYLLFWVVPQINDLIVVINQAENDWIAVFIFFATLTVFAFLISTLVFYFSDSSVSMTKSELSRLIPMDKKEEYLLKNKETSLSMEDKYSETQQQYIQRIFPKFLGTFLILITAYAVNNTYQKIYFEDAVPLGNWGLLIFLGLFIIALNKKIIDRVTKFLYQFKWFKYVSILLLLVSIITILILGTYNKGGSKGDMWRLYYSLISLAIFFLTTSVSYNNFVLCFKKKLGVPIIIILLLFIFIAYVTLLINPQAFKKITPISIVMISLTGIFTLLNFIKYLGHITKRPIFNLFIFICIALGVVNAQRNGFEHYETEPVNVTIKPSERIDLSTYIEQWIKDRKPDILSSNKEEPFPIILVSAEGGGSRAGLWSFLVQSYLYEQNPDYFEKYLFSMSGASGGGVGNNMFYTHAYQLLEKKTTIPFVNNNSDKNFKYRASLIYDRDYLSTSVASLLGRDLFKSITNLFEFDDRGSLLEKEWEEEFMRVFKYKNSNPLGKEYLALRPQLNTHTYIRPLLITNTTNIQSGERAIISPVKMENDKNNLDVFCDLLGNYPCKDKTIKRSSAMSMNARFPYISPVARITGLGQFGDAGYYNNIGGSVTNRLEKALVKSLKKDTTLTDKYEIRHLLITNYTKEKKDITYYSQLVAPINTILNSTFAHPKEMEKTFKNAYNIQSKRTCIPDYKKGAIYFLQNENEKVLPFIPLGRYLSNAAISSMERRLESDTICKHLDKLIQIK